MYFTLTRGAVEITVPLFNKVVSVDKTQRWGKMETSQIYKVTTEGDCEGRSTKVLGYATGCPEDIMVFYDDQKEYNIHVEKIKIVHVNPKAVKEKRDLLEERTTLRKRLGELENILER